MTKEYLKMADVFDDASQEYIEQLLYAGFISKDACEIMAHAVSSHDELVAENERLVSVLWEVDRVLSEMQKNGVLVYGLDDVIDEVSHSLQS